MYVLPRGLESAWSSARKRAWVPIVPFGETILGMAAMGMVMNAYKVMNRNSQCARNADHRDFPARAKGHVGAVATCNIPSVWSCIGCRCDT